MSRRPTECGEPAHDRPVGTLGRVDDIRPLPTNSGWFERGVGVFFVAVTVVAASRDLAWATLIAAVTLLSCYAARRPTVRRGWPEAGWLAALTAAWFAAVVFVSVAFVWVSVPLMFLLLLTLPLQSGLPAVAAITGAVIGAEALDDGLVVAEVAGPILGAGFAIVACVSYRQLATEHEHTQRALGELEAARKDLARSEHQRGMLDERRRLAREVHDTVAQDLAGILLIARSSGTHDSNSRIENLAATALHEARRIVDALGPVELEAASLPDALAQLADHHPESSPTVHLAVTGQRRDLPQPLQAMLLRVAQGAVANCRDHAQATTIHLTLSYLDDEVAIDIVDDGQGFEPCAETHQTSGSFGLSVMRERAQQVGGTLVVETRPGAGTAIHAAVPTA